MVKISVIVPIYKGTKYIPGIIAQIEANARVLPGKFVELVLSNDDPQREISGDLSSDIIKILVLNTEKNRGIHGARVRGLSQSKGEYILFLDQDDAIDASYLKKQLGSIGDYDAVVCNILSDGLIKYNTDRPLYKAISRESMIKEGNMISSPGQVLLRRSAIPDIWRECILHHNGADDWFLWICMHACKKTFVINDEVLFSRRVHYYNTSSDTIKMTESEEEVAGLIAGRSILNKEEFDAFSNLIPRLQQIRVRENESWKKKFLILNDWLILKQNEIPLGQYLHKRKIGKVAIYGYGYLGKNLLSELSGGDIPVKYLIDKNARYIHADIETYTPEEEPGGVDAVVISLLHEDGLDKSLSEKLKMPLIWLEDMIYELVNGPGEKEVEIV